MLINVNVVVVIHIIIVIINTQQSLHQTWLIFVSNAIHLQNSFNSVETLQELEQLTSDVLLPLISHSVVQGFMKNLKYVPMRFEPF